MAAPIELGSSLDLIFGKLEEQQAGSERKAKIAFSLNHQLAGVDFKVVDAHNQLPLSLKNTYNTRINGPGSSTRNSILNNIPKTGALIPKIQNNFAYRLSYHITAQKTVYFCKAF